MADRPFVRSVMYIIKGIGFSTLQKCINHRKIDVVAEPRFFICLFKPSEEGRLGGGGGDGNLVYKSIGIWLLRP